MHFTVALGGGLAGSLVHWGVLDALRERGQVVSIAAVGWGALWAALWARGLDFEIVQEAVALAPEPTWDSHDPLDQWLDGSIAPHLADLHFEALDLPLAIVLSDLEREDIQEISQGPLWPAILASIATPPLRPPVNYVGRRMADGTLLAPLPVERARELGGTASLLAVDLLHAPLKDPVGREGAWHAALHLMTRTLRWEQRQMADIVVSAQLSDWPAFGWANASEQRQHGAELVSSKLLL